MDGDLTEQQLRERIGKRLLYHSDRWETADQWLPILLRGVSPGGWVKATVLALIDPDTGKQVPADRPLNVHPMWWGHHFRDEE